MVKKYLCGMSAKEIEHLLGPSGYNESHALLITNSIYKKRITDLASIKNLSNNLKDLLNREFNTGILSPVSSELSADKTVKYLFRNEDGKLFETVYIPEGARSTVCVSTQSGCRMGCSFCATAGYGFHGDLTAGEIVSQVISLPGAGKVTHVVLMGMGEPMDNLDNVLKACRIFTAEWGLSLSPRNVTVSTVGITPGIEEFLKSSDCNLTLSLFSPFSAEREKLVPAERVHPVRDVIDILKDYPLKKKRRLSLAYIMIHDLNDSDGHLEELKNLLTGSRIRVNLLPYHQTGNDGNRSSSVEKMMFFKHNLVISGISASIRKSRGADISAACGLLASGLR
jgi:23S rRNA (adenine2503-C2)-methyltransferase